MHILNSIAGLPKGVMNPAAVVVNAKHNCPSSPNNYSENDISLELVEVKVTARYEKKTW